MATITTTLTIADRMTAPLRNITSALQYTVDALHSVNTATVEGFDTTAVNKAQQAINLCNDEIRKINVTATATATKAQQVATKINDSFNVAKNSAQQSNARIKSIKVSAVSAGDAVQVSTVKMSNCFNKTQNDTIKYNAKINNINANATAAGNSVQRSTAKMSNGFNTAKLSVSKLLSVIGGLSVVQKMSNVVTGQLDSAFKRMDTMTNYDRTMTAITGSAQMAKASLNGIKDSVTGTAYGLDTAASAVQNFVTRGMDIGNATSEVTKWLDAVSFYGPGTNEALGTVTDALGKMMSKGTVEMEQLNRLTDVGINAVGIYAQATGRSTSSVQDALSKGTISSQNFITTVSTAFEEGTNGVLKIAGAAKGAATTWSATFDNSKAAITRGWQSFITEIDTAVESVFGKDLKTIVADFGKTAETTLGNLGTLAGNVVTMVGPAFQSFDNSTEKISTGMGIIIPLFATGLTIFGLYKGAIAVINGLTAIHTAVTTVQASVQAWHNKETQRNIKNMIKGTGATTADAAAKTADAAATEAAAGAQFSLNTAMLACPALIVVGAIMLIIAVITILVASFNGFKTETTTGLQNLAGSVFVVGAGIYNFIIGILNGIIQLLYTLFVKPAEDVMNWVYNIFTGGFSSMQDAFTNLLAKMLGGLVSFAQAFTRIWDDITGQDVTSKLDSAKSYLDKVGSNEYYTKKFDFAPKGINRKGYKDAYGKGVAFANKMTSKLVVDTTNNDLADMLNKISNATASTADSASSISDSVATTSENIEYLKDMAEEQIINRYTNSVNVEMINHNNINSDLDIDDVTEHLRSTIEQGLNSDAGGKH